MKRLLVCFAFAVLPASTLAQPAFDAGKATAHCEDKWTERGVLDAGMFDYCMEQQRGGYADTVELLNLYTVQEPVELIDEVLSFAVEKWLSSRNYQFDMVAYELEQQAEAFLNIQYEVDNQNVDNAVYEQCKSKWVTRAEPQWTMVEYCVDN
ncbi:hypothetical protein [Roseovarius sp. SYSU LYC5161]|uniref:hypothetical protein n=1 Tax=Roseovarius halophilus (ex Wu et al. 2025) TaxID=3376060 RepID=UPI00399A1318